VKRVLQHGVDLNARSEEGMTAMDYAVQRGKEDVVQLLFRAVAE
jgi:ankyrin repeat protein